VRQEYKAHKGFKVHKELLLAHLEHKVHRAHKVH
jgi:hypothetical protein